MNHIFQSLRLLASVMAFACVGFVAWAFYLEEPFLSYENIPFPPTLKQVRPGEVIPLTVARCNSDDTTRAYTVSHALRRIDMPGQPLFVLRSELVTIAPGCHESTSRLNVIPLDAPGGIYIAEGLGIVEGTMRSFAVKWESAPFQVIAP